MREIRQSGSEGGGGGMTASPYPYSRLLRRPGATCQEIAGTRPAMTM